MSADSADALGPGFPRAPGLCVIEALAGWPAAGTLRIARADERVLISDVLLAEFRKGRGHPDVSFGDGIVTICGVNRTVSYGLVNHDESMHDWLAVKAPEVDLAEE